MSKNGTQLGKFISFEGGEGTGKSTQVRILSERLNESGLKTFCTREPGGTALAEEIRNILVRGERGKCDPYSETLLHFAARRNHLVKKIWPALQDGTWVICDRFTDSSMAYQGMAMEVGESTIKTLSKLFIEQFSPNLTFVMDLKVEEALRRTEGRVDGEDRYESMGLTFHDKVRKAFLDIAAKETNRCVVIDSMQSVERISTQIMALVEQRFEI